MRVSASQNFKEMFCIIKLFGENVQRGNVSKKKVFIKSSQKNEVICRSCYATC